MQGVFQITHVRNGRVLARHSLKNMVTNQGFNRGFDLWFNAATNPQVVVGLIDGNGFGAVSKTDTVSSHGGWTSLAGFTLQPLVMSPAILQTIPTTAQVAFSDPTTNGTRFDLTANGFVKGIYIQTNDNAYLWSTAVYTGRLTLSVNAGDALYVTYKISNTPSAGITNQGMTRFFDLWFQNGTNNGPVMMGLINSVGFSAISATDTVASHPGWSVFTGVSGGPLQPLAMFPGGSPTAGTIITDTTSVAGTRFNITTSGTIRGIFIQTSDNLYMWASQTLISFSNNSSSQLSPGDSMFIVYSASGTSTS